MPSPNEEVFILIHVPKTGGTSLNEAFSTGLELSREFIRLDASGFEHDRKLGLPPFAERAIEERNRARVVAGHDVDVTMHELIPGRVPRYFTFIREPASRLVSAYNFEMHEFHEKADKPTLTFEEWYAKQERDVMTKFLGKRVLPSALGRKWSQFLRLLQYPRRTRSTRGMLERVNRALGRFWYVGTTKMMDRAAPLLLERMGIEAPVERKGVTGRDFKRRVELDSALRERLQRENPMDVELFRYWETRDESSLERALERS